jgi:hypothetical protein
MFSEHAARAIAVEREPVRVDVLGMGYRGEGWPIWAEPPRPAKQ